MDANNKQVGGEHYNKDGEQHWDRMWRLYGRGYFVGCATKYIERYHLKNGEQDLEKAIHFLEKLKELEYGSAQADKEIIKRRLDQIQFDPRKDAGDIRDHQNPYANIDKDSHNIKNCS